MDRVEIDTIQENEWNEALSRFEDASLYQTWAYGAVRWGEDNLSHLVLYRDDKIVAMAQLRIASLPVVGKGIAYVPWGPLWKANGNRDEEIFQSVLSALNEEYVKKRGLILRLRPYLIENWDEALIAKMEAEGFQKKPDSDKYRTFMVDITPEPEVIRKNLAQKWRNQLNRAEKNELQLDEGTGNELYTVFLDLVGSMLDRKNFTPGVDYKEFQQIQKQLPENQKMRILICRQEGQPVAALIGSAMGETGIYLLGATNELGMKCKGSYLMQWRMIQWLKQQGCRWYDLGGINPETNPGVHHFKSGIAGKTGLDLRHLGEFENSGGMMGSLLSKSIDGFRQAASKARKKLKQ